MKYFGRAARMEPCKRIGTGCTIYALPVSKILNKEIRVLQCESLGAGISFPRLGRRGYAPQRNVARPRRTQRKLQQYIKAFPTPRALTKRPYESPYANSLLTFPLTKKPTLVGSLTIQH